jgi:hypothetical protein
MDRAGTTNPRGKKLSRTKMPMVRPAIAAMNQRCDRVFLTPDEFIAVREMGCPQNAMA